MARAVVAPVSAGENVVLWFWFDAADGRLLVSTRTARRVTLGVTESRAWLAMYRASSEEIADAPSRPKVVVLVTKSGSGCSAPVSERHRMAVSVLKQGAGQPLGGAVVGVRNSVLPTA